MELVLIVLLRTLVPLTIFRWPLFGGILSFFLDCIDWKIFNFHTSDDYMRYQQVDKMLDMYYLSIEAYVSMTWNRTLRNTSAVLYVVRLLGFLMFELTRLRFFLFLFPNVFESFYIFVLAHKKLNNLKQPLPTIQYNLSALIVFVLTVPKVFQEYALHVLKSLPWQWFLIGGNGIVIDYMNRLGWILIYLSIPVGFMYFITKRQMGSDIRFKNGPGTSLEP